MHTLIYWFSTKHYRLSSLPDIITIVSQRNENPGSAFTERQFMRLDLASCNLAIAGQFKISDISQYITSQKRDHLNVKLHLLDFERTLHFSDIPGPFGDVLVFRQRIRIRFRTDKVDNKYFFQDISEDVIHVFLDIRFIAHFKRQDWIQELPVSISELCYSVLRWLPSANFFR